MRASYLLFIQNLQREDVPDISYQFRFDGYRNERDVTTQDLANWYVVFGAYANLTEKVKNASVSGEEERRMTTLLQVLVGVLNDYNKVVRKNSSITMHAL